MFWMDGFTFEDNLINNSFLSADSNGELSDHRLSRGGSSSSSRKNRFRSSSSSRKTQNIRGLAATSKAKRRRHAHYKLNTRLDRKSSRGMIYENEELRLRTININAEVERGQTDIKRLRKENETLRREIWSLRDEYDRLNKKFKTKFTEPDHGAQNARCSQAGCSCQCNDGGGEGCDKDHSKFNSEDSDSCDSCCCHDEDDVSCNEECYHDSKQLLDSSEEFHQSDNCPMSPHNIPAEADGNKTCSPPGPSILTNFDHLSVVSEETLSNSDVLPPQAENLLGYTPDISGSQTTLPSLVGPLTPLTPVEMVANELNDLQAVVPPLSYFENILQQHMSSSTTPGTSSSNSTGKTVIRHTNGWDYNLQSPFTQKRYHANSTSANINQRSPAQTLTTFIPLTTVTPPSETPVTNDKPLMDKPTTTCHDASAIETVPITTMPVNGCVIQSISSSNSNTTSNTIMTPNNDNTNVNGNMRPKNFFGPMKPKLKLNTALANQKRLPPPPPPPPSVVIVPVQQTTSSTATTLLNGSVGIESKCEPPDIYVTNGLATPYKYSQKPSVQPPPIPQRSTSSATPSAQVSSPRQRRKSKEYQSCLLHEHMHQHPHRHHYQHQLQSSTNHVVAANTDACAATTTKTAATITTSTATCSIPHSVLYPTNMKTSLTTALLATNILCMSRNKSPYQPAERETETASSSVASSASSLSGTRAGNILAVTASTMPALFPVTMQLPPVVTCLPAALACLKFINSNINISKPNEPVYAIAQNVCHNLIIAPAVNQPLMTSIVKCCTTTSIPVITKKFMATTLAGSDASATATGTQKASATALTTNLVVTQTRVLSNIACCATINSLQKPIITKTPATPTESPTTTSTKCCCVVDSMCQTDSVNLESILNDIEAISEDILAIQLEKTKSKENLGPKSLKSSSKSNGTYQESAKNSKPYRSEMNLLLTYDGDNPKIKQTFSSATPKSNDSKLTEHDSLNAASRRTKSLEREHTDSPSPNIPDPMQPFPDNRNYIGFERLNNAMAAPRVAATATQTSPVYNNPVNNRTHLPLSPLVTSVNMPTQSSGKGQPPIPPARSFPSPLNIRCAGIQRSSSVTYNTRTSPTASPVLTGVPANKSHLFSVLATAAARRAQFRSQPTSMTKSLDPDLLEVVEAVVAQSQLVKDDKGSSESVRRKTRRVSIVCTDTDSTATPDKNITSIRTVQTSNATTASCSDLPAVLPNPALRSLKQTSHSTPNSPHSLRKQEASPLSTPVPPTVSITPATPHHGRNSQGNGSQHHQAHSNSYPHAVANTTQQRKNSQDAIKASAAEIACAAANAVRSKCSRRHSDGTVSHTNQRSSGTSGGTNGGHHHTHHNHHHHQHSSSVVSTTNPHHSHHSRQDSNQETAASSSDRNSNSLASSRESSASFSMRSTRRKLSVSSHTGGKIPWCGCWGNGCL